MDNEETKRDPTQLYDLIEIFAEQVMQRFDDVEQVLRTIAPKSMRTVVYLDGERLYDNQDICEMFGKSKRSLQRYRSEGSLPYVMIKNSAHYKESHIESFKRVIAEEFAQQEKVKDDAT